MALQWRPCIHNSWRCIFNTLHLSLCAQHTVGCSISAAAAFSASSERTGLFLCLQEVHYVYTKSVFQGRQNNLRNILFVWDTHVLSDFQITQQSHHSINSSMSWKRPYSLISTNTACFWGVVWMQLFTTHAWILMRIKYIYKGTGHALCKLESLCLILSRWNFIKELRNTQNLDVWLGF